MAATRDGNGQHRRGGLWLLPRLGSLQRQYRPGRAPVRQQPDQRSACRWHRSGDPLLPGIGGAAHAVHLFDETIAPVANPTMGAHLVTTPEALAELPLLEFDDPRPWLHWRNWLGAQGYRQASRRGILRFNQYDQVIHAALAGQGVALGRLELIQSWIDGGQLVVAATAGAAMPSPTPSG
jgi:DNA-binding transcriptional LysR family regulator